jgi:hypothetical protein
MTDTYEKLIALLTNVGYQVRSGSNSDIAKSTRLTRSRLAPRVAFATQHLHALSATTIEA